MHLAARKRPEEMTAEDRATLAAYSGWGGLSIQAVAAKFPTGFPMLEERGLIHEYYTPTKVAREVARVIRPLLPELPKADGALLALEPSAGIGRFVQAASGPGFEDLSWLVVEWSEPSSRMLQARREDLAVYNGPFERWVREHGPEYAGRLGRVLANPPYGARGASITEDPDRSYREKAAYAYFLRRWPRPAHAGRARGLPPTGLRRRASARRRGSGTPRRTARGRTRFPRGGAASEPATGRARPSRERSCTKPKPHLGLVQRGMAWGVTNPLHLAGSADET
jgi:predicted RNA methylase